MYEDPMYENQVWEYKRDPTSKKAFQTAGFKFYDPKLDQTVSEYKRSFVPLTDMYIPYAFSNLQES